MQRPTKKVLIREGQDGRLLLGGRWYFRQDDEFVGEAQRWFAQRDLTGWSPVGVPSSWNATDLTENKGTVGWYRKEFSLPEAPKGRPPLLEGALRGQQLPQHGLAERPAARGASRATSPSSWT